MRYHRYKVVRFLYRQGYRFYPKKGSHTRMYLPGDCETVVHIPNNELIPRRIVKRIEEKTGLQIVDRVVG